MFQPSFFCFHNQHIFNGYREFITRVQHEAGRSMAEGKSAMVCTSGPAVKWHEDWLGRAVIEWPSQPFQADLPQLVALVSSHTTRHPEWDRDWRDAIESSLRRADSQRYWVLATPDTPMGEYLIQLALRLELTLVLFQVARNRVRFWLRSASRADLDQQELFTAILENQDDQSSIPLHDRILASLADRVDVVSVRAKGEWSRCCIAD